MDPIRDVAQLLEKVPLCLFGCTWLVKQSGEMMPSVQVTLCLLMPQLLALNNVLCLCSKGSAVGGCRGGQV